MKDRWWWSFVEAFFFFCFAGFAGGIGYIMRQLNANKSFAWSRVVIEAFGAAFVGFLVYQLCLALDLSSNWTGVVVGVCGWLGSSATIQMLEPVIRRAIGANKHDYQYDSHVDHLRSDRGGGRGRYGWRGREIRDDFDEGGDGEAGQRDRGEGS